MVKRLFYIICLFVLGHAYSFSQSNNIDDLFFNQGHNYYNAGYAPTTTKSEEYITAFDTRTMLKIAPNNTGDKVIPSLTYQAFSKVDRLTFSYNFNHQSYSYTANNEFGLGVIYSFPFNENHQLSIGLRGDFSFYNLKKFNDIEFLQLEKPKKFKILADIDFGLHYSINKFELGVSGKHLLASRYAPDDILFQNQRDLYTYLSYSFKLGKRERIGFKPAIFMTPATNLLNSFFALEFDLDEAYYFQYAFKVGQLRNQFSFEYHFDTYNDNSFFIGLAFTQSLVMTDYNIGLRFGYFL